MAASSASSDDLLGRLREWANSSASKTALSFLDDAADVVVAMSYGDLARRSDVLAYHLLQQEGLAVGDRVLLVYPPSLDFVVAFLACLKAGLVAVPTYPPDPRKLNKDLKMFATVAASCGATAALTSAAYNYATKLGSLQAAFASLGGVGYWPDKLKWVVTDAPLASAASLLVIQQRVLEESQARQNVAFLQYTSGSTSDPKGVVITKENLTDNLLLITTGLAAGHDTVVVSWLPQYHDMGLIGAYLGLLYCGGSGYYLSPLAFVRNPVLWVRAMSRYRATHVQAPNFAYALTARKFLVAQTTAAAKGAPALDLSSLRHMINAAEPVEAAAIDLFYGVFEQHGLRRGVIFPTYGLAEHTVYVCSNGRQRLVVDKHALETERVVRVLDKGEELLLLASHGSEADDRSGGVCGPPDRVQPVVVVGCGKPSESAGVTVRIVDADADGPAGTALADDRVGEIWVASRSCARGYWGLPELSAQDFNGTVRDPATGGTGTASGFLRTGDLGFLHAGELFVCGRVKDLVIVRGRNHYPQDIERTCEGLSVPTTPSGEAAAAAAVALRGGCSAAFSVPLVGQEQLVYVAELTDAVFTSVSGSGGNSGSRDPRLVSLMDVLRREVSKVHGVGLEAVVLVAPRSVAKTSSGKIARQKVRGAYLRGELQVVAEWSTADAAGAEDDGLEVAATTATHKTSGISASSSSSNGDSNSNAGAIDPTGMAAEELLPALQQAVAECLEAQAAEAEIDAGGAQRAPVKKIDPRRLSPDASLVALGMDSMRGIQLQALLEALFTVQLPDELMFEPDATLRTLAAALAAGGHVKQRPVMVDGWKLLAAARKRAAAQPKGKPAPKGALPPQWFRENEVKADVDAHRFPDKCALRPAPLVDPQRGAGGGGGAQPSWASPALLDAYLCLLSAGFYGVFVWVPVALVVLLVVLPHWLHVVPAPAAYAVAAGLLAVVYLGPWDSWPPASRLAFNTELTSRYFSYRVIVEKKGAFGLANGDGGAGASPSSPCIYAFGPHGVFSIGPALQAMLHEYLLGDNFHLLVASAAFYAPVYNVFVRLFGYRACDRATFKATLQGGRSVGIIPGGIAEMFEAGRGRDTEVMTVRQRKGFVKIALETGVPIVPCYCFGNTQIFDTPHAATSGATDTALARLSRYLRTSLVVFWGRFGLPIPFRVPLLTVIGRPIPCPKVDAPSPELVNEYHDLYLRETKRIYDKYRNCYGWDDRPLVFKR